MPIQIQMSHGSITCAKEQTNKAFDQFQETIQNPDYGFFQVNQRTELLTTCQGVAKKFTARKNFIQVGIGGSSLGPEMLITSLGADSDKNFIFINNIDSDKIHYQLKDLDLLNSLFYFVSKSGGTAEPMAAFAIISGLYKELGVNKADLKNYYVFATDPQKSDLLNLGRELGIDCLEIPSNVGGRFSVLTPVGLFPAVFAGIDAAELLLGAEAIKPTLLGDGPESLKTISAHLIGLWEQKKINQTVFMPYSSMLRDFSFWFVQLWAESLGKRFSIDGTEVFTGMTPIPSYGATDQHSQMQLFMEGPNDKCLFLIEVEKMKKDFPLINDFEIKALKMLNKHTLHQLMRAELLGSLKALKEADRPTIHFKIKEVNAHSIGAMVLFFESLTAIMGHYLAINPFDQPGVEAGKIYAYEFLDK